MLSHGAGTADDGTFIVSDALMAAILHDDNMADGIDAGEVAAARYAATSPPPGADGQCHAQLPRARPQPRRTEEDMGEGHGPLRRHISAKGYQGPAEPA
jgi:hypothetical protein